MSTKEGTCVRSAVALLLVTVAIGGCAAEVDEGLAARTDWALGDPNMSDHCYGAACCPAGLTKIVGTSGANVLNGTFGSDCLVGLQGNDTINGNDGGDTILCGPGADTCAGDLGEDTLLGSTENDQLLGGVSRDVLIGGLGNDTLRGGTDADSLVPGLGADNVLGEQGNDLILVNAACEISRGERLNGGDGTDTIQSHLSLDQIRARGATITSVELSNIVPRPQGWPNGSCYPTEIGFRCDCCDDPGLDVKRGCQECVEGYHRVYDVDPIGNDTPSALGEGFRCEPDITCRDLNCGEHGACVEENRTATCVCEQGYAGPSCTSCAPLYERTAFRQCEPGDDCDEELCNGHGQCVEQEDGSLGCDCDEGWDDTPDCNGPDARIGGPDGEVPQFSTQEYAIGLRNGAHCTTDFEWSVVEGNATISVDDEDSKHVYVVLGAVNGLNTTPHMVKLRAECGNNPFLWAEHSQVVVNPDVQVQEINGTSRAEFEPFDDAMATYIGDRRMHGATLAVSYLGNLMYLRAYGHRDPGEDVDMRTCTPMRVASVTKPFTRAGLVQQYGQAIPPALGGGTLAATTPIVPLISDILQLQPIDVVPWQAPASMYSATFPGPNCTPGDGLLNSNWNNIQVGNLLNHTSGLQPNTSFVNGTNSACTGAAGESCGSFANVNDPTTSASSVTSIANLLGLDHGIPTQDELIRYMGGICPYDAPNNRTLYSNFAFTVAGRILERVVGQDFEPWMQDFLAADDIIDLEAPGSPWFYMGQNYGDGPASGDLPAHLEESYYWSFWNTAPNVNLPVYNNWFNFWFFPTDALAPYGAYNYDLMAAHGGVVTNALALANFMRTYRLGTGLRRGGAYPNTGSSQGGLLPGTNALIWELPVGQPGNTTTTNVPGCLVPENVDDMGNVSGLSLLDTEPCPLPAGITVAVIFNTEAPTSSESWFVRGLHDPALLQHVLRAAASEVGDTAAEWGALTPLDETERQIGCELKCPFSAPFCVDWQCGDGDLQEGEECDDGDNFDFDGCQADCTITPPDPETPPGYDDCAGENPGECLGGPCAHVDMQNGDRMNPQSEYHPDGNWSPDYYCMDSLELNPDDELGEITCVREEYGEQDWGVCLACGVDTFMGCVCPGSATDEGINGCDGLGEDLTCIGGRCWQDAPEYQPDWMCSTDCRDIYGPSQGYCSHDGPKGAVCLPFSDCSEPVDGFCNVEGGVCDTTPANCVDESNPLCNQPLGQCTADNYTGCCEPECIDNDDCALRGYVGHICDDERCVNHAD